MTYTDEPVNDFRQVVGTSGQLIDVREPSEFSEGTLPGATNIPLGELPSRLGELDTERRVVLLCRSGGRSANAAAFLANAGFADVVNLAGGMLAVDPSH
ncbi:MAG: rhodanese-like domain-containing protein [Acidimicrobiales bacterium]